jgi:ABC-type multidrug transport system ATPase subunit
MMTLECDGVLLDFGYRRVLSDIYLRCGIGEVVGILGRNGSGKSCLLQTVFGALVPESKSVRINEVSAISPLFGKSIAYRPQHHFIPPYIKLRQAFSLYGVKTELVEEYFAELMGSLERKPGELSGGVLKIFEIMLVAGRPLPFILLDEPFSGIMPVHIERVKELLGKLKSEKGILITDHLYRHVLEVSDRLYVLANGKTYSVSHPDQLIRHGYTRTL